MIERALLSCRLEAGMFPSEYSVFIDTISDEDIDFFCPKDFIHGDRIEVHILERSADESLIRLPVESYSGRCFVVSNDLLCVEAGV